MSRLPSLGSRGEGWVVIQFVLLGALAIAGLLAGSAWEGEARVVSSAAAVALLIAGGVLAFRGLVDLRAALTPLPHPRDGAELVDTGAYALVRHPIYGGLVIGALGWGLLTASIAALAGTVLLLGFFDLKSRREEDWLLDRYPGYAAYRARTRRLIPGLY